MAGDQRYQDRMVQLVRAFGLHQPDRTPCGKPVTVSEAHALMELAHQQPLTQNELAARLRLEKSTVSRLVGQLDQRGWVRRERDPTDGRARLLRLTGPGQRASEPLAAARTDTFARIYPAIPPADR